MKMKENEFYKMCDVMEQMPDLTEGYYPTVKELEDAQVKENLEEYLAILCYFASDPFTVQDIEGKDDREYVEMVKYVKKLLYEIELIDDEE